MQRKNHRSLERALDILELLADTKGGLTLSEICTHLDLPKSSAFSLVHTLSNRKYLNQDEQTGKFSIALKLFEVGSSFLANTDIHAEIKEIVHEISTLSSESVHLTVLDGTEVVYIMKEEGTQTVRMASSIGKRLPAHATAVGKALLSGFSDDTIRDLYSKVPLTKVTPNTITQMDQLLKQLREIRIKGYAFEMEESTEGVACVASPIENSKGEICAAVSISFPIFRMEHEKTQHFQELVKNGAYRIEKLIKSLHYTTLFS